MRAEGFDYVKIVEGFGRFLGLVAFHQRYSTSDYEIFRQRYLHDGNDLHWVELRLYYEGKFDSSIVNYAYVDKMGKYYQICVGPTRTGKQPDIDDYKNFVKDLLWMVKSGKHINLHDEKHISWYSTEFYNRFRNSQLWGFKSIEELIMKLDLCGCYNHDVL